MKSLEESRAHLRGLFNITVTPFGEDGVIDIAALAENIERVLALGYDGILIDGTYGEFATMNPAERAALFRRAMQVEATGCRCCCAMPVRIRGRWPI